MSDKGLERFRRTAETIYAAESKGRPGLRKASRAFKVKCLAVIEAYARQGEADYRGRRTGLVKRTGYGLTKGERAPVAKIGAAYAWSKFVDYLKAQNEHRSISRRQVIDADPSAYGTEIDDGETKLTVDAGVYGNAIEARHRTAVNNNNDSVDDSVAAGATPVAMHGGETRGGYEAGGITEYRSKRPRGAPPGMSQGSRTMSRDASQALLNVPWDGSHFIAQICTVASGDGWELIVPRMPWPKQIAVSKAWRVLRGGAYGAISLIDPNVEKLFAVPGTVARRTFQWRLGLVVQTSLLDTVGT